MRKLLFGLASGLLIVNVAGAKQVSVNDAQIVASNFIQSKIGSSPVRLSLLDKHQVTLTNTTAVSQYIFDLNGGAGFVIVAADDVIKPILAYSVNKAFQVGAQQSPETTYWLNGYDSQIQAMIISGNPASEIVSSQWAGFLNGGKVANKPTAVVEPLLSTTWNQGEYYDLYTPGTGATKTPVGCVATAMAQIMKYWNYPTTGVSSYSYNSGTYGTLSANFGTTTYDWSLMPDNLLASSLTNSKEAVSEIGYHAAVAVRMDFAPSGSGSQVLAYNANAKSAQNAFKNNFGYSSSIQGLEREDYTDAAWIALLEAELNAARPVLYAGYGQSGGHAFVFDGYDENDLFHINWGWGGMSNGYFTVDNLAPSALGIGGGGGNFNYGQQALMNIFPTSTPDPLKELSLAVNNTSTFANNEIFQGDPFSLSGDAKNISELDFVGGFVRAEVYNNAGDSLKTTFGRLSNQTLLNGNSGSFTFNSNGSTVLVPGSYNVKLSYMGVNGTWITMPDNAGFVNNAVLTVKAKPTGIANVNSINGISIYPNPANDYINLDLSKSSQKVQMVSLLSIQGSLIKQIEQPGSQLKVDLSGLSKGTYILQLDGNGKRFTEKIQVR